MSYFSHFAFLRHAKKPQNKQKTKTKYIYQKNQTKQTKHKTKQKRLYGNLFHWNTYLILLIIFDFTRNGPDWQSYRSAAQQSVKPTIIKNYIEPQAQCADDLVTWLEKYGNNNPEVKFAFMCYSADGNASD